VGRSLQLRHAPQLEFTLDETFDRAARLSALIAKAVKPASGE
jgi:ribosome-binding factor A